MWSPYCWPKRSISIFSSFGVRLASNPSENIQPAKPRWQRKCRPFHGRWTDHIGKCGNEKTQPRQSKHSGEQVALVFSSDLLAGGCRLNPVVSGNSDRENHHDDNGDAKWILGSHSCFDNSTNWPGLTCRLMTSGGIRKLSGFSACIAEL